MRRKMIILAVFIMLFTGCGVQAGEKADGSFSSEEQEEVSPAKIDAIAFLEDLSKDKVMPVTGNHRKVKKKYPEWFGKNGKITYPILPGSDKWKKAKTAQEMNGLCQIPKEIINAVDTRTLLKAVEDYPILYAYTNHDYYELGLQYLAKEFYGMNVLLRREDAYRVAAESYLSRNLKVSDEEVCVPPMIELLLLEEFLISREDAYYKFSEGERREILEAVEKNYDAELNLADGCLRTHFYDMAAYGDNPWKSELP
ncbi:hypothetical protein D7V86_15970 [bacterium D16-51]|nr:hypothetical protein D7V96_19290 [bacterium D16-59]RKI58332.1 hypothetical protein D7V86_15970 [bacterium D16-51]